MTARIAYFMICFLLVVNVAAQETRDFVVGVTQSTDAVSDGYILFSPIPSNIAYLIDNKGEVLHQWQSEFPMLAVELLENGDLLTSVRSDSGENFPPGTTGRIERYDWNNQLIWSYDFNLPNAQIHHDVALLPNGHILLSMWETLEADEIANYGINPELAPEANEPMFFDRIIEIDSATNEIVWQWRLLDHSVQDYDDSLPNYGIPAENPQLVDINYNNLHRNVTDRSHLNAIEYHPELEQIMVSAHFQSEIWIIDHNTGDLVYRWGNPEAYGRGLAEDQQLFNQHNPVWLDNGNIQIFNNGRQNVREFSSVIEIVPPLNDNGQYDLLVGSAYAPLDTVWEYRADPPESFFAINTSGAQRLENGNIFITQGPLGQLFEIDAEGNIVWEYLNPVVNDIDEYSPLPIFRATRYSPSYPAFEDHTLTPEGILPVTIFNRAEE